jgi:hypothetical protein
VAVYATSFAGTNSATVTNHYFFRVPMNLILVTNGTGTVSVSPTPFYVNRAYTLTATAGANCLFSNVVEMADSGPTIFNSNKPVFLGQSNVAMTVDFVANRFVAAAGTYYGLFGDTNVTEQSAGWFTATVASSGSSQTFTASLFVDGDSLSGISGAFDISGAASNMVVTRKGKAPLTLNLQLNFDGTISGTVSDTVDGWSSALDGNRSVYSAAHPSPYAGNYNLLIPGSADPTVGPPGYGCVKVTIAANGAVTASGSLADGQTFGPQAAVVSANGNVPIYAKAYVYGFNTGSNTITSYKGLVGGWLNFSNMVPGGNLAWIKTGWTNGYYNGGFTNESAVVGSVYSNSLNGLLISDGLVTLSDGDLTSNITDNVTVTNALVGILAPTNQLVKLTITPSSGLVSGTFTNTADHKVETLTGLYLPEQGIIGGYFMGTSQGGVLMLQSLAGIQDQIEYTNIDGAITVAHYVGLGGVVAIPDTINDLPVTNIGEQAFNNCFNLTNVTIPDSVITIGDAAFAYCTSLSSVTIPNSVTNIESWAFAYCISLTTVTMGNGVTSIGDYSFAACTGLTGVYFQGNAPGADVTVYYDDANATVYYLPSTTGWGSAFGGLPTATY